MRIHPCRGGALASLAALALLVAGRAEAGCTNAAPAFVTTIDRTFPSGSRWTVHASRGTCEGLIFSSAVYTPAGGTPRLVLSRANIAEIHVPYLNGGPRFLNLTGSGLGANAVALTAAECEGGTLFDGNRICVRNKDGEIGWRFGSSFRLKSAVEVFMSSQVGAYNYIDRWVFEDDGSIEPMLGLTGWLQEVASGAEYAPYGTRLNPESDPTPHIGLGSFHNVYYRLDFDIAGAAHDAVARQFYEPSTAPSPTHGCATNGECGTTKQAILPTETNWPAAAHGRGSCSTRSSRTLTVAPSATS